MPNNLPKNVIALLEGFLIVSDTLNISQAAKILGISRMTLQNRLKQLEKKCGYKLLEFDNHNRYKLTPRAENWVQEVRVWLRRGEDIFSWVEERSTGLLHSFPLKDGEQFYCQQHSLMSLWKHETPYLVSMLETWIKAQGEFENPAIQLVRDNAILARMIDDKYIIMEIGKDAAMMSWLGEEWCRSAIGKPLSSTPMSSLADQIVTYSYRQSTLLGTPWYDHVSVELPRPVKDTKERAYYRRLVLPCKLLDGSSVIASVVEITDKLVISGLEVPSINQPIRES